ncbi:MAG: sodium:solute symporter family protein [Verrucomicrobiota bacterium]
MTPAQTTVLIISGYLALLLALGIFSGRFFRGTSSDYFVASRSIGGFMLLMSVFGTTMTAFAMVGSTGEAYRIGIGTYGKLASYSGLIHSACFFFVGLKLWSFGKRHNYMTQIQFFRDRFESNALGYLLFPILVGLVIPYLLVGLLGAGAVVKGVTRGAFPELFEVSGGSIPTWLTGLVICGVVLTYIFIGGVRSAAWANTFQTIVFMIMGVVAFLLISRGLGGFAEASAQATRESMVREGRMTQLEFFSYGFIPLSVGMFPHLFQHWLTAKSAKSFHLTLVAHPIFIMLTWVPCILIGMWATGVFPNAPSSNAVLGMMVGKFAGPIMGGLVTAGVLAAIMSSLDSQFVCLGTMFTQDVVVHKFGKDRFTDRQIMWMARGFVILIVLVTYGLSLLEPRAVFSLGVWCFSGFASLFPLVLAAVYWKRVTKTAAIAAVLVTASVWFGLFAASDFGKERGFLVLGAQPVAFIFLACLLTIVVVSLFTRAPSEVTLSKFFPKK